MINKGIWCSLITPFNKTGELDLISAEKYVKHLDQYDFAGFLFAGSVGEGLLLELDEISQYCKLIKRITKKQIMLGVIDFNYERAVKRIQCCIEDVDYLLVTPCIYFKPDAQAIVSYIKKIAALVNDLGKESSDQKGKQIVLYNNPSRVGVAFTNEIYSHLYGIENIVGVKECVNEKFEEYMKNFPNWKWFSGNDDFVPSGAYGLISTLANVAPQADIHSEQWIKLCEVAYSRPNPIYVKEQLASEGIIQPYFRAPFN